ncbi:EamA family transporter [Neisseria sp.]|uniref:EamA family transporter n=1 Tax=Neisseria sp. TaxID=192066 RepID=UPI00289F836B|nr:EamA family transporter [Neisseria sp.]
MPARTPTLLLTALAPLIWGSTYFVTTEFLPPDRPLTAAVLRVLPAGLLLLLWTREWPAQADWGKLLILGILNLGFFQAMLFVAAYRLPGGLAAILSSTQTLMVLVWMVLTGSRPAKAAWWAAALGVLGVVLLVASPQTRFDTLGVAAALAGALSMATGVFLTKRWQTGLSVLALTGWQLLLGGLCLLPAAYLLEPGLPVLTARNIGGYLYLCLFGAVLAYVLFFRGIRLLPPAVVSSLGLLSPVCAYLLGWLLLDQGMGSRALLGFSLVLASIYGVQQVLEKN